MDTISYIKIGIVVGVLYGGFIFVSILQTIKFDHCHLSCMNDVTKYGTSLCLGAAMGYFVGMTWPLSVPSLVYLMRRKKMI